MNKLDKQTALLVLTDVAREIGDPDDDGLIGDANAIVEATIATLEDDYGIMDRETHAWIARMADSIFGE